MIRSKLIIFLFLLVSSVPTIHAQKMISFTRATLDSLMNPKLLQNGEEILNVDQKILSIGTINESDSSIVVSFNYTCKIGTTITRIQTTCGCTTATYNNLNHKNGEKGKIELKYNPKNHFGQIKEHAYVYTSESKVHPVVKLTIIGEVVESDKWSYYPYVIGDLRLKRKLITIQEDMEVSSVIERIPCVNIGKMPLKICADELPEYAHFHVEPTILAPEQEGDLVITINNKEKKILDKEFSFRILGTKTNKGNEMINVIIDNNN